MKPSEHSCNTVYLGENATRFWLISLPSIQSDIIHEWPSWILSTLLVHYCVVLFSIIVATLHKATLLSICPNGKVWNLSRLYSYIHIYFIREKLILNSKFWKNDVTLLSSVTPDYSRVRTGIYVTELLVQCYIMPG